uniref:Uncharacterized protein n=1 Tax=Rhizophora mucronata TaxID=61149 RepID=A0A2P2K675_RHIMU
MAESRKNQQGGNGKEEEDYMGDLSQFLPPETLNPPILSVKKVGMLFNPLNL